jgi:pimeloyl-ACP methyl ester carboxylesterase
VKPCAKAKIGALFPHSTIESIAGAGHWLHAEQPRAVVAALERFLDA